MSRTTREHRTILTAENRAGAAQKAVARGFKDIRGALGGLVALIGAGGLAYMVKQSLDTADALGKTSQKLGLASKDLASLRHAAEMTGVSQGTLDMALQRMTRRLSEAAQGSGEAKNAIKELGLDAQDLASKSPDKAFADIAEAIEGVSSQSDKVRLAFKFFDSEGVDLVNTLALGKDGLAEMAAEAEKLGIALDDSATLKAAAANDAITRMQSAGKGAAQTFAIELAPAIETMADLVVDMGDDMDGAKGTMDGVTTVIESMVIGVMTANLAFKNLGTGIGGVAAAISLAFEGEFSKAGSLLDTLWADIEASTVKGFVGINAAIDRFAEDDTERGGRASGTGGSLSTGIVKTVTGGLVNKAEKDPRFNTSSNIGGGLSLTGDQEGGLVNKAEKDPRFNTSSNIGGGLSLTGDQEGGLGSGLSLLDDTMLRLGLPPQDVMDEGLIRLDQFHVSKLDMQLNQFDAELALTQDYTNQIVDMEQAAVDAKAQMWQKAQSTSMGILSAMQSGAMKNSKKGFKIAQMAAIGETIINTHKAATGAYAALAPIPYIGPALGAAAAAAAIAAGMANVSAIKSQSFGGGGGASPAAGITPPSFSSGGGSTVPVSQPQQQNVQASKEINIIIHGNVVDHDKFAREMIPSITKAINDGVA